MLPRKNFTRKKMEKLPALAFCYATAKKYMKLYCLQFSFFVYLLFVGTKIMKKGSE